MTAAIQIAKLLALVSVTILCVFLAQVVYAVKGQLPAINKQVSGLLTDADRTTVIIAGTATNIEKETRQWRDQSEAQIERTNQATITLNTDLLYFGDLLKTADSTLLRQDASLTNLETQVGSSITQVTESLRPSLLNLSEATSAFAKQTPPILDNLSQTSKETVTIAGNISGMTDDMHHTTTDVAAFSHRELAPVRGTWNVLKSFLVTFAGPAAQVATAIK